MFSFWLHWITSVLLLLFGIFLPKRKKEFKSTSNSYVNDLILFKWVYFSTPSLETIFKMLPQQLHNIFCGFMLKLLMMIMLSVFMLRVRFLRLLWSFFFWIVVNMSFFLASRNTVINPNLLKKYRNKNYVVKYFHFCNFKKILLNIFHVCGKYETN